MDWNDWLPYMQNSDHVLTWNGDGYQCRVWFTTDNITGTSTNTTTTASAREMR